MSNQSQSMESMKSTTNRLLLERHAIAGTHPGTHLLLTRSAKYRTSSFILRAKFSINDWFCGFLRGGLNVNLSLVLLLHAISKRLNTLSGLQVKYKTLK